MSLSLVAAIVILALMASVIAPYDPNKIDTYALLKGPTQAHLLGTDYLGRDTLSRVLYGSRTALEIALPSVIIGFGPGLLLGLVAGYLGGAVDKIATVIIDTILSFPAVILAFVLLPLFGRTIPNVISVIAIALVPSYGRLARALTLSAKNNVYVKAERSLGASPLRVVLRHIFPNILPPLLVLMAMDIPAAIGIEAGLAFLGIGVQPPTADWGVMLNSGFANVRTSAWGVIAPLLGLILVTGTFTVLGETLRDLLDPRLAGARTRRTFRLRRALSV